MPAFLAGLVIGVPIICLEYRRHVALQDLDAHGLLEQDVVALVAIPTMRIGHPVLANPLDDEPHGGSSRIDRGRDGPGTDSRLT